MGGRPDEGPDPNTTRVVNVAVLSDGLVLLVRRADSDSLPRFWEIPGGAVEARETFRQAATRELFEETGIRGVSLEEIHRYYGPAPEGFHRRNLSLAIYRCVLTPRPRVVLDSREHSEFRWVEPSQLASLRMMPLNRMFARWASGIDPNPPNLVPR